MHIFVKEIPANSRSDLTSQVGSGISRNVFHNKKNNNNMNKMSSIRDQFLIQKNNAQHSTQSALKNLQPLQSIQLKVT